MPALQRVSKNDSFFRGAKTVEFCALLGDASGITTVLDVNPAKQGTFLVGAEHVIRPPQALRQAPRAW